MQTIDSFDKWTDLDINMDLATFQVLADQTGLALFATLALFLLWFSYKESLRRERANAEIHRSDKLRIVDVLQDVAKSNTEL